MSRMSPEVLHLPAPVTRLLAPRVSRPRRSVVIGGGIAGVAAATVLCERGVDVTLIEREPLLGGRAGGFEQLLQSGARVQMREKGVRNLFLDERAVGGLE